MQTGQPSRTASAAATYRAAHQVFERGAIFSDPLALRIVGLTAEQIESDAQAREDGRRMRLFIAARTRFAEDSLANAIANGVTQLVVLGAGLDTYAYRMKPQSKLLIFEVDHPTTQAWKREQLAAAEIAIPPSLTFAPINFETQTLREALTAAAFDFQEPTFFTWLGVVPYLSETAIWATLSFIASLPGGAHVVFDYADPPALLTQAARDAHDERAAAVAAIGEAWVSYFSAEQLHPKLRNFGFSSIEDLGPTQIFIRYFARFAAGAASSGRERGGHIIHLASHG